MSVRTVVRVIAFPTKQLGDTVVLPVCFPELPRAGRLAVVVDRELDDWVLQLDPSKTDYDDEEEETMMLWPIDEDYLLRQDGGEMRP